MLHYMPNISRLSRIERVLISLVEPAIRFQIVRFVQVDKVQCKDRLGTTVNAVCVQILVEVNDLFCTQ